VSKASRAASRGSFNSRVPGGTTPKKHNKSLVGEALIEAS